MINSFIIKNADESFDNYFNQMKKRKGLNNSLVETSMFAETKVGIIPERKPTPRDGHTANISSEGFMFIFGGDRHHMPFND
eukprot:CAMPEP_0170553644 /NCGR_PEP_ID=MMETSP0211-20121228/11485_1 /TAXON_ID=311385 /ORGANISM="Pseudokeronopsis sp., Strain OXSARD2" /LENGTH=80 /DNA_ID=CAMNT_0010862121 /DNA_START=1229 /DNA_END=1468 /DNA_ORIENTATION=-